MRYCLVFACLILAFLPGGAQVILQPKQLQSQELGVVYEKETAFNVYLHTRGFGLGVIFGELKTWYKTSFYHIDLGNVRHPNEYRPDFRLNQVNVLSRPYVYGKKNSFYAIRFGKGQKRYLSEKAKRNGVAMAYSWQLGPSLGVLKPYYLDVRTDINGTGHDVEAIRYSTENRDIFLDPNYIDGSAGFWKGLGESTLTIGGHLKGGAHFAFGAYDRYVRAIEVGLLVDFYFHNIDILAEQANSPFFANLYLNLQFGRRK